MLQLEQSLLPAWLPGCRWFGGKGRGIEGIRIAQCLELEGLEAMRICVVEVSFDGGKTEIFLVPLAVISAEAAVAQGASLPVLRSFENGTVLCDALWLEEFRAALPGLIWGGGTGDLRGMASQTVRPGPDDVGLPSRLLGGEQSNTAIIYGGRWFLKFLRQFEPGPHPDLEVTRFLTEETTFAHSAPFAGALVLRTRRGEGLAGLLMRFTPNQGDCWLVALKEAGSFLKGVEPNRHLGTDALQKPGGGHLSPSAAFAGRMRLLGQRTAELHVALASRSEVAGFAPEPFTPGTQRDLYEELCDFAEGGLAQFRQQTAALPAGLRERVERLDLPSVQRVYAPLLDAATPAVKTRVHGDYHLGQVLDTGTDFVVIDFGGEPRKSLAERNGKRCPLVDVAGMLRSFDYAASVALRELERPTSEQRERAENWGREMGESFLQGWLAVARPAGLAPEEEAATRRWLRIFLLDKAIYEIGYELGYRPDFLEIPLRAVEALLREGEWSDALPRV